MSAVMFDLYGTLIEKIEYDYGHALRWLADTYFNARFEELQELSWRFKVNYLRMRAVSDAESSFRKQLEYFETIMGCNLMGRYGAIEAEFIKAFRKEKPREGAESLLGYLYEQGARIYVLTNSLFSGENLKAYLTTIGIPDVIVSVYSSADIGRRKPSPEAFRYAMFHMGERDPHQVLYIGDSYEKDYLGASKCGMRSMLVSSLSEHDDIAFKNLCAVEIYLAGQNGVVNCA